MCNNFDEVTMASKPGNVLSILNKRDEKWNTSRRDSVNSDHTVSKFTLRTLIKLDIELRKPPFDSNHRDLIWKKQQDMEFSHD